MTFKVGDNIIVYNPITKENQYWGGSKNLELVTEEEKPVNKSGAMGREEALRQRQRLSESGLHKAGDIRLVNRSWDNEARYFAVDVYGTDSGMPNAKPIKHFQTVKQTDEYLASLEPIDVAPSDESKLMSYPHRKVYTFTIPGTRRYLRAPDDNIWFTEEEIRHCGGIVTQDGKRYRLGRTVFHPFVSADEGGGLTVTGEK